MAAKAFCTRRNGLFCHDGQHIWDLSGNTGTPEKQVCWMAQTGPFAAKDPLRRYISRITARLAPDMGATVRFYVRYDSKGQWHHLGTIRGQGLRTFSLPLRTRRCDSLELRLEGVGQTRLYSLQITSEQGSDLP